jgi:hypothetical protein
MLRLFIFSILLISATACGHNRRVYYTPPSAEETHLICNVDSIDSQVAVIHEEITVIREKLNGSTTQPEVRRHQTLQNRMNRFGAEVDVQYRNMVASCRTYARCMQVRRYSEGECRSSLAQWDRAQSDFSDLTRELREIDAEVAIITSVSRDRRRPGYTVNPCDAGGRNCEIGRFDY